MTSNDVTKIRSTRLGEGDCHFPSEESRGKLKIVKEDKPLVLLANKYYLCLTK